MAAATRRDSGKVSIYRGNETGLTPVFISGEGIAGYDFRGKMDVLAHVPGAVHDYFIAFRLETGRFWLIRHNPDGTYTATHKSEAGVGGFSPGLKHKIATFLDRDGSHIVFWGDRSYAHILINEENETLELIDRAAALAGVTPSENHAIAAVDLDSDGFTDLIALNTRKNTIAAMLSRGRGAYQAAPFSTGGFKGAVFNKLLGVGHFNQDARPDLLLGDGACNYYIASLADGRLTVMGAGTLPEAAPTAGREQPDVGGVTEWIPNFFDKAVPADINGDGITDVIWNSSGSNESLIYIGEGGFKLNEVSCYPYGLGHFGFAHGIVLPIDFRGNGCQGIISVLPNAGWATLISFHNQAPDLLVKAESPAGASSKVVYTPSSTTAHRLMPVMQLVKERTIDPGYGPVVKTRFEHHGGFYDPRLGEFLGFSEIKEIADNGRWSRAHYHQTEHLRGMPYRQDVGFGSSVYKRTETDYYETGGTGKFIGVHRRSTALFEDGSISLEEFQYDLRNGMVTAHSAQGTNGLEIITDSRSYELFGNGWRCVANDPDRSPACEGRRAINTTPGEI